MQKTVNLGLVSVDPIGKISLALTPVVNFRSLVPLANAAEVSWELGWV